MSGLVDAVLILVVVVVVVARQFRARRISTGRRWWAGPAVLGLVALREPGLLDPHHQAAAAALLGAELLIGMGIGAGWAWTSRVWTDPDGTAWSASTRASAAVWFGGIALRLGLFGIGVLLGVRQDTPALLLGLASTLLVRGGVLAWRSQFLRPLDPPSPAYGDAVHLPLRKEPV
ncbi:DUF1453 domain-containing protein [Streptomyces sp. NPDC008313]|uniref:DUF1453 domain-containing protein n=1 Tax=Streptomyces sp. NPDC008313 TaxID=3364826 RepID=UPI0036E7BE66